MVGQPRRRAREAALAAAQGVEIPPRKVWAKKPVGRPPKAAAAGVVSSLPPKSAPVVVDPVDASFGAALASAAGAPPGTEMNTIFEELRTECMRFALKVMRMELDIDEKSFNKVLGVQQQITTAVLTATTRIRPGDLREKDDDGLGALLAQLKRGDAEPTAADLLN